MKRPALLRLLLLSLVAGLSSVRAAADDEAPRPDPALLTLERIYGTREFESKSFAGRWLPDGSGYSRLEASQQFKGRSDIVAVNAETGQRTMLVPASRLTVGENNEPLTIENYEFSHDMSLVLIYTRSQRVWRQNTRGDYWVLDRASHKLWQLGGDARPSSLMFARFSPTSRHVAYLRDGEIHVEDLRDQSILQLTRAENEFIINGTFDWVYEEELGLRDGFRWSPDGRSIAYWQLDTRGVQTFTMVNNTESLYPRTTTFAYPKVGQVNASSRVGVVDISGGDTRWLNVPGDPREHYIARMDWVEQPPQLVIQQLDRLQNTNRVMLADPRSGEVTTIHTETDEAWVDMHDEMWWLDENRQFTWISESDGWRHVSILSRDGQSSRRVTALDADVIELLHVDETGGLMYFTASPDSPAQRYLYSVRLDGSDLRRRTPADHSGTHRYEISPDGKWAIHTSSSFDMPPVVDLVRLPEHETVRVLEENKAVRKKVELLKRQPAEFFSVDIGDDVSLEAWCIAPPDRDATARYPLLVYVYGEPAGQTVVDAWAGNTYLWHQMLAQQGYFVISIDNRGTNSPRGRDWRRSIYRQIGVLAPQDQAAALRAILAKRPEIDAERIGIWGWSGGGSMSLNAIFKYPELYQTAIAVAPVPNQRYYDTIYQERYMGLPEDNVEGYLQGSPINFAHQLQGNLLLIHGTGDDNCHYQTTEMLINELVRHNKRFTMMAYPNRTHAIREGTNTTRHLRELMTWYLQSHLPAGPRPR